MSSCCTPSSAYNSSTRRRRRRRRRSKGIHSRPDTNRTGAEGLSFYYFRLLHCLNQMLEVVLLSQHRVSSSKTVRPRAPCGARSMGRAVSTWSAVCSEAPHSNSVKKRNLDFIRDKGDKGETSISDKFHDHFDHVFIRN